MSTNLSRKKGELLRGAGSAAIAMLAVIAPTSASAQATADVTSTFGEALVQQQNDTKATTDLVVLSSSTGSVEIDAGELGTNPGVQDSTLSVGTSLADGNTASASSIVNEASKTLNVAFNNGEGIGISTVSADTDPSVSTADADMALAVSQQSDLAAVSASQSVDMGITADDVATSTLNVIGNQMTASGVINSTQTAINLDANNNGADGTTPTLGGATGIAVAQTSNDSSLLVTSASEAYIRVDEQLVSSTASLDNNTQSAVAVGQSGSNSIVATGNTLWTADASVGEAVPSALAGLTAEAKGGNAIASMQALAGNGGTELSAIVDGAGVGFRVSIDTDDQDNVISSTISNDGNRAAATIRGNEVSNEIDLTANAIYAGDEGVTGTAAAVASVQVVADSAILAASMGVQGAAVSNDVSGSIVNGSRLTASDNTISADANGNRGANQIAASGTSIDTAGSEDANADILSDGSAVANGGFALASTQVVDSLSTVSAILVDSLVAPTSSASVETDIGEDVSSSSIASNGNLLSASATGNLIVSGTNAIDLSGTNLATTAALANYQEMGGNVTALIGVEADVVTNDVINNFTFNGTSTEEGEGDFTFIGTTTTGGYDADDVTALSAVYNAQTFTLLPDGFIQVVATGQAISLTTLPRSYTETGVETVVPSDGGVIVTIGDDILASSITVDGNRVAGSATGNGATNRVSADATNLTPGSVTTTAEASIEGNTTDALALADFALANGQRITSDASLTTSVISQFAIRTEGDGIAASSSGDTTSSVTESTLSVSGNVQTAATIGNSASNALDLGGSNLETTGALTSYQYVEAATISATSTIIVEAPAANNASTLMLNSNSNSATATSNTATNTVSIAADNALRSTSTAGLVADGQDATLSGSGASTYLATGDFVLNNAQTTAAAVSATAVTLAGNNDGGDTWFDPDTFNTDGVFESTVEINGNTTNAAAYANRSNNTLNLSANTTTAGAGVLNQQLNLGAVDANASARVGAVVTGGIDDADDAFSPVDTSSVSVSNNRTSATAGGNTSANALNASATTFAVDGTGGLAELGAAPGHLDTASATYAVLNQQANVGGITAVANVTYGATFVAPVGAAAVTNSSVTLSGNSASTLAYGNASSNTMTLNALNTGAPSTSGIIASEQANYGAINATTTSNLAINASGPNALAGAVTQSSLAISGSSLRAQAVGNSNSSVMTVNANNITFGNFGVAP